MQYDTTAASCGLQALEFPQASMVMTAQERRELCLPQQRLCWTGLYDAVSVFVCEVRAPCCVV